jgi:hypothetical protein
MFVPDWVVTYIGGGILVVIGYILLSNTFWLLFGSSILQKLPGVNIRGAKGTLKIALLIILSIIGFLKWVLSYPVNVFRNQNKKNLKMYLSDSIKSASITYHNFIEKGQKNE